MLVCYDKLFPEAARALALDGAEIACCLAAWPVDRHAPARRIRDDRQTRHFAVVDQARAVENQVFVASANQTGAVGPAALPRRRAGRRSRRRRARPLPARGPGIAVADARPRGAAPLARDHRPPGRPPP